MKYCIFSLFLMVLCNSLLAQENKQTARALDHALIDGPGKPQILKQSRSERVHYAPDHYKFRTSFVVDYVYKRMYHLSKEERKLLLNALRAANLEHGTSLDEIHAIVATQMKDILSYNQYTHWLNLASYPEYEYFSQ